MSYMLHETLRALDSQSISQENLQGKRSNKERLGQSEYKIWGFCMKWDVWADLKENKKLDQQYVSKSIQQTN